MLDHLHTREQEEGTCVLDMLSYKALALKVKCDLLYAFGAANDIIDKSLPGDPDQKSPDKLPTKSLKSRALGGLGRPYADVSWLRFRCLCALIPQAWLNDCFGPWGPMRPRPPQGGRALVVTSVPMAHW